MRILGWREGALAEREGRPSRTVADSPEQLRFTGTIEVDAVVRHVVELAAKEAAANRSDVGPEHVLVALLLEGESIGAGTGAWLGMTPGRVRAAAGLINEARVVAEGAPHTRVKRGRDAGPIVLAGGGSGPQLPQKIVDLVRQATRGRRPRAVLVDVGHRGPLPAASRQRRAASLGAGRGVDVVDSGVAERHDAFTPEVSERLAAADLVWLAGGDAAAIYDRLWATPALEAIFCASEKGAVVGGASAGAMVWGAGMLSDYASLGDAEPFPLFGWLGELVVFAHYWPTREQALRQHLAAFPDCRAVGVAHGGVVVVSGPDNDVRVLGRGSQGTETVVLNGAGAPLTVL